MKNTETIVGLKDEAIERMTFENGTYVDYYFDITDEKVHSYWEYSDGRKEEYITDLSNGHTEYMLTDNAKTEESFYEIPEIAQSAEDSNTSKPIMRFPAAYTNIGSLVYNYDTITNETLTLTVKAKQNALFNDHEYIIRGDAYDSISKVTQIITSIFAAAHFGKAAAIATCIVNQLSGNVFVNGALKAALTEKVRVKGNDYGISVYDAKSGNTKTFTGSTYRVISSTRSYNKLLKIDYYGQFIADRDTSVANDLFIEFRGFGVNPGVKKWNVTRTVDSNT